MSPSSLQPQPPKGRESFNVLSQVDTWDNLTKGVVLSRLVRSTEPAFFPSDAVPAISALLGRLVVLDTEPERGADESTDEIPVLALVDSRLAHDETDGYRYEDMPKDQDVWLATAPGLEQEAHNRHRKRFSELASREQDEIIREVATSEGSWQEMPAKKVFDLWLRYACTAFYSHPDAWSEIGFGGPAYPRGYKALGVDKLEPWER